MTRSITPLAFAAIVTISSAASAAPFHLPHFSSLPPGVSTERVVGHEASLLQKVSSQPRVTSVGVQMR
jgi:hypothetical protein